MCEIAVTKNQVALRENGGADDIIALARLLCESNDDGLGVVAVHTDGETFSYNRYKHHEPDFDDVRDFLLDNDEAWRFVLHARLATAGGVGFAETHPISVKGCPKTDLDYVVHNGVVHQHDTLMAQYEADGHEFTTDVDSEVIAHAHGEIPDELEEMDEPDISGRLNYLLFSDDGILVKTTTKYEVGDDFTMACGFRSDDMEWSRDNKPGYHLFRPDGESSFRRKEKKYASVRKNARRGPGWAWGGRTTTTQTRFSGSGSQQKSEAGGKDADQTKVASTAGGTHYAGRNWCTVHERTYNNQCPECFRNPNDTGDSCRIHEESPEDEGSDSGELQFDWDYCEDHGEHYPPDKECPDCQYNEQKRSQRRGTAGRFASALLPNGK